MIKPNETHSTVIEVEVRADKGRQQNRCTTDESGLGNIIVVEKCSLLTGVVKHMVMSSRKGLDNCSELKPNGAFWCSLNV